MLVTSLTLSRGTVAQTLSESLVTADNAYNPIPSPDGKYIAYVRTGWGEKQFTSFGRSSLVSDVKIMNLEGAATPRTVAKDYFLSGWTPDSVQLICYRDWRYALISTEGMRILQGRIPNDPAHFENTAEWVAYSPLHQTLVWSRRVDRSHRSIETPGQTIVEDGMFWRERVVPSPDGRYLAVFREESQTELNIFDLRRKSWTNLGWLTIHPDKDWWYIQPNWNPWFADSSRLVFVRDSALVVSTADGTQETEIKIDGPAGLAVPSPDGRFIAYVTFEPRSRRERPDLQFWGGTTILVVSASTGSKPHAVTQKNPDEVDDLKWLNDGAVVFDRIADEGFYAHARVWKAAVPR
jgi:Tol biopolymer transport system component